MQNQIVFFELGSEHFGADTGKVQRIIQVQRMMKLAHART